MHQISRANVRLHESASQTEHEDKEEETDHEERKRRWAVFVL